MAGRRCPGRDERDGQVITCPEVITGTARYCPTHARGYEARRGTSGRRGYGVAHQRLRAAYQRRIDAGETITCATCHTPLSGKNWDLGHNEDRTGYIGPQCLPCNRSDGGKRGRAKQTQK